MQSSPKCPICASTDIQELVDIRQVPVFCNLIWDTPEEARSAPRGDIQLGFCNSCSHIYNQRYNPELVAYTQGYENSLHFSPRFQAYAHELAARLVQDHGLNKKTIIEIGSGQGDFLKMLCDLGDNRGLGFDPSYIPTPEADRDPRLTFVPEYYAEEHAQSHTDFILSRHVYEHVPTPDAFLASLRRVIGDRRQIVVFFEVPNALFTLRELGIWDVIYEHYSYFTPLSLQTAFRKNGFEVLKVAETFNGQFLTIEAAPRDLRPAFSQPERGDLAPLIQYAAGFTEKYRSKLAYSVNMLEQAAQKGKKVVLWGAGSKGVTFLNVLGSHSHQIEYIVDINPRKKGKFVAGSGQEIIPPAFLTSYQPDVIIVMNANYKGEIQKDLENLGVAAEILMA